MEQCLLYTLAFLASGTTLLGGMAAVRELRRHLRVAEPTAPRQLA